MGREKMSFLYAGDSEVGGPANYLLGILRFLRAKVVHVPPAKKLKPRLFKKRFDAIILSDFSRKNAPADSQTAIAKQVETGTGLLMVGGWRSFSGPFGGWRGSLVEKLLPVNCLVSDDRLNFPGGALIDSKKKHRMFRSISFKNPPVICGLNQLRPKKKSRVILTARRIVDGKEFPLLIVHSDPFKRTAALATDLAPHWCGGLVDWGSKRIKLRVDQKIQIEVGDRYVRFVSSLIRWLVHI